MRTKLPLIALLVLVLFLFFYGALVFFGSQGVLLCVGWVIGFACGQLFRLFLGRREP